MIFEGWRLPLAVLERWSSKGSEISTSELAFLLQNDAYFSAGGRLTKQCCF